MKKTLIAAALFGLAGSACASDIKVNADIYSGTTRVSSYTVIVGDGQAIEVHDMLLQTSRENPPGLYAATVAVADDLQQVNGNVDTGISLKMTPHRLDDGRILLDAAVSSRTLIELKHELVNGQMTENPITREHTYTTQMIVASVKRDPIALETFAPDSDTTWVSFSAAEI